MSGEATRSVYRKVFRVNLRVWKMGVFAENETFGGRTKWCWRTRIYIRPAPDERMSSDTCSTSRTYS